MKQSGPRWEIRLTFYFVIIVIIVIVFASILVGNFGSMYYISAGAFALAAVYLGLFLAFAAQFIPSPVGCNLTSSCPADPMGAWSTIWPNVLSTCLGVVLLTTGYGRLRSRNGVLPGLGVGLVIGDFFVLVQGLTVGYTTSCPANGCLPLTASQWWSLFWPDVIADMLGTAFMIAGSAILIMRWRPKAQQAVASETSPTVPSSLS